MQRLKTPELKQIGFGGFSKISFKPKDYMFKNFGRALFLVISSNMRRALTYEEARKLGAFSVSRHGIVNNLPQITLTLLQQGSSRRNLKFETFMFQSFSQGIQYLRFLVLVLSTFGIGIGIGIESIPGLVNGIDPIVNWY